MPLRRPSRLPGPSRAFHPFYPAGAAVEFLLTLVEPDDRGPAGERAVRESGHGPDGGWAGGPRTPFPASGHLWTLQQDDPGLNALVYRSGGVRGVVRDEIRRGLPFGRDPDGTPRRAPLHVADEVWRATDVRAEEFRFATPAELVAALRSGTSMKRANAAARRVGRDDWGAVVRADRDEPLPGYARWALAVRLDCPDWARAGFDTHPAFGHRLRRAGIYDSPLDLLDTGRPARHVLEVLYDGDLLFPGRQNARKQLRRTVRHSLGADLDAWGRVVRLLPGFTGTVAALLDAARRGRRPGRRGGRAAP